MKMIPLPSIRPPARPRCFCGYDRSGLGDDDLCPECGELRVDPDGLWAKVRHAWLTTPSRTVRAGFEAAGISAGFSILISSSLVFFVPLGLLYIGFMVVPILAWLFAVVPLGLFGILGSLTGLDSENRRLATCTALMSITAIIIPIVFFLLANFLIRSFA